MLDLICVVRFALALSTSMYMLSVYVSMINFISFVPNSHLASLKLKYNYGLVVVEEIYAS
jgi:hypothetical protein